MVVKSGVSLTSRVRGATQRLVRWESWRKCSCWGVAWGVGGARSHLWWEFSRDASSDSCHLEGGGLPSSCFSLQFKLHYRSVTWLCSPSVWLHWFIFFFFLSCNDYLYIPCFILLVWVYFCCIHIVRITIIRIFRLVKTTTSLLNL